MGQWEVADPGEGANPRGRGGRQHTILPIFFQKLHEIERIWTPRRTRIPRPILDRPMKGVHWMCDSYCINL